MQGEVVRGSWAQAKVQRQVRTLWRWTGLVFLIIAAVVLVIALLGGVPVGLPSGCGSGWR